MKISQCCYYYRQATSIVGLIVGYLPLTGALGESDYPDGAQSCTKVMPRIRRFVQGPKARSLTVHQRLRLQQFLANVILTCTAFLPHYLQAGISSKKPSFRLSTSLSPCVVSGADERIRDVLGNWQRKQIIGGRGRRTLTFTQILLASTISFSPVQTMGPSPGPCLSPTCYDLISFLL